MPPRLGSRPVLILLNACSVRSRYADRDISSPRRMSSFCPKMPWRPRNTEGCQCRARERRGGRQKCPAMKTTLRPEEPVNAPEDGAAGQNLIERIGGEDHVRFLAEASEILAGSLDYETELERVARLIVPILADWCAVDLLAEDGRLHRLVVVHRDPAKAEAALELQHRYAILSP